MSEILIFGKPRKQKQMIKTLIIADQIIFGSASTLHNKEQVSNDNFAVNQPSP